MRNFSLFLLLTIATVTTQAQTAHRALRDGNKAYKNQNFDQAKADYNRALEADNSAKGNYNLGNALYEGGEYEAAAKKYEEAASLSNDPTISSSAYRNLGDAQYQQEQYQEAVEAYKQSLRINPDDQETKYNLSKAIRQLQQQQQQQQQDQQNEDQQQQEDQQNKDQQQQSGGEGEPQDQQGDQQSQGDKQQQQEQQGESEQEQEQQDGQSDPQNKDGQPQANKNQPKMSREEAERQLGIAAEAEKETMKKLQKGSQSGCRDGKDW